jgi:hypothetical protein
MFVVSSVGPSPEEGRSGTENCPKQLSNGNAELLLNRYAAAIVVSTKFKQCVSYVAFEWAPSVRTYRLISHRNDKDCTISQSYRFPAVPGSKINMSRFR